MGESSPVLVRWLVAHSGGLIHSERQAQYVLVFLSCFAIVASIILARSGQSPVPKEALQNPAYGLPMVDTPQP
jgi:hypothetical protein